MPVSGLKDQCSNQCQNQLPDETGTRFVWQTSQKLEPDLCHRYLVCVSWTLHPYCCSGGDQS